jgi:predicted enzyme related to lactoylglutathione lyase
MAPETFPLIHKVDCVRLYVSDLAAGLSFYRDHLGHELVWRTATAAGLRLPASEAEIVLQTQDPSPEVDLAVESADQAAARIVAAGGRIVVPPFDIQIGRCVIVEDPWGNRLVLLDASQGLLQTDEQGYVIGNVPPEHSR